MRHITPCPGKPILLGRLGENEATSVRFDIAHILEEYGEAEFTLVYEQPGTDEGYPVTGAYPNYEEGYLEWIVTDTDLSAEGRGRAQLIAESGGTIVKTEIYMTMVLPALDGAGDPPSPWDSWQEAFGTMASETRNAARTAMEQAQIAWEDASIASEARDAAEESAQGIEEERAEAAYQAAIAKINSRNNSASYTDRDGSIVMLSAEEVHTADSAGTERSFFGHAKGWAEEAKHEAELAKASAGTAARYAGEAARALNVLQPAATSADVGKALVVKTVSGGKATEYEYGEAGGGLSGEAIAALLACFENVVWATDKGNALYRGLREALLGVTYTVTYELSGCTSSTDVAEVAAGDSFTAVITADAGMTLGSIYCTMGGEPQTVTNDTISIASVTGDIVIRASAGTVYTGYDVVGSPVIVNGILTPSEGNYVTTNVTFPATVPDVWELRTKCIRVTDTTYQDLAMTLDADGNRVRSLQLEYTYSPASLLLSVFAGTGGSSWNVMNGTQIRPALEKDVWYWVRVGYDGAYYYMEYSADGATYTRAQYRSDTHIGAFNAIAFGKKSTEPFTGSIDLAETAFYIDGELFWRAM